MMKRSTLRLTQAVLLGLMTSFPIIASAEATSPTGILEPSQSAKLMFDINSRSAKLMFDKGTALIEYNQITQGIKFLDKATRLGHGQAAYELAALYESGLVVEKDHNKAKQYYEKAIQRGHNDAHFNLALMFNGERAPFSDLQRARNLMQVVAQQGDLEAQFVLAGMMNTSVGNVASNPAQALHWFGRAANRGHENAQFQLGMEYLKGTNVAKNSKTAFDWFSKAAKKNVAGAHFNLALMHERGDGVAANIDKAFSWYTTAANLGNPNAQHSLGIKYLQGNQVALDAAKSLDLFTRAASAGLKKSQLLLGQLYQSGYEGKVNIDLAKAEQWYLRAAKQGQPDAQYQLALILLEKKNQKSEATLWIQKAVAAGHQDAMKLQSTL